jgi:hypothetical protein
MELKEVINGISEAFYMHLVEHVYSNIDWYMSEIEADGDEYEEIKSKIIKKTISKFK